MQQFKQKLSRFIFMGRWIQLPLYLGLMIILVGYVFHFLKELVHLMAQINTVDDVHIMLGVLDLIDVVMIANLLIMVIMGGYEIFVSHLLLESDPDQPEWLDHLDASGMKVKLALSLIGISSVHLLRTFIEPDKLNNFSIMWQVLIHLTLLVSALAIAFTNRLLVHPQRSVPSHKRKPAHEE